MKSIKLTFLSLAATFCCGLGRQFTTANAKTEPGDPPSELEQLQSQFAEFKKASDAKDQQITDLQSQVAVLTKSPLQQKLDLKGLRLPKGIKEEDVLWRVKGGLDISMAVQAAVQQKNHDDAEAKKAKTAPATQTKK